GIGDHRDPPARLEVCPHPLQRHPERAREEGDPLVHVVDAEGDVIELSDARRVRCAHRACAPELKKVPPSLPGLRSPFGSTSRANRTIRSTSGNTPLSSMAKVCGFW